MWNKIKIIYWVSTGLFAAMMCMSALTYIIQSEWVKEAYLSLGYPTYLIYLNAAIKILGAIVLLSPQFKTLKEWSYAGFTYLLVLAGIAHIMVGDNEFWGALVALVLLAISYISYKKILS